MWKNKIYRKNLRLYCVYRIRGFNIDRLLNSCKKRNVTVLDVKKIAENITELTIKYKDCKIFFAITRDLCYNINCVEKVKVKGLFYPLLYLYKNIGILIGIVLFILTTYISNDFIFSFNYYGTGSAIKSDITNYLNSQGISKYSRFSQIDLSKLEDSIMANFYRLSFVSCTKKGNTLNIESTLEKQDKTPYLNESQLVSNVDGKIESIKLYRGRLLLQEGDYVKSGDVIVTANDSEGILSQWGVIANVSIICEKKVEYISKIEQDEELVLTFLLEGIGDIEPISTKVEKNIVEGQCVYLLSVYYRCILYTI